MSEKSSRREFMDHSLRIVGIVGIAGATGVLARRAASNTVFQVDPSKCVACDLCRTSCVLSHSAVKAVNVFNECGYCQLCPAYFDVTSQPDDMGLPTGKVCPQDALKRHVVGKIDKDDPNNNYYEYTIDESLCDGCGKCVKACKPPAGNGALHLEVRYSRCLECDSCSIQIACPQSAIVRIPAPGLSPKVSHGDSERTA
ncbi:MAG TPA: 4Fe-4S binding protein [Acidobacteriota bacterium]|nr:4Fe-4S binding protein [Acidobacteriota bacterium]